MEVTEGLLIIQDADLDSEVEAGCGVDRVGDVPAFTHEGTLLMPG